MSYSETQAKIDLFFKNQMEIKAPIYFPNNGVCPECNQFIINEEIANGNDGTKLVEKCPLCGVSYWDLGR